MLVSQTFCLRDSESDSSSPYIMSLDEFQTKQIRVLVNSEYLPL